jgi:catechol 2,3-dioxygenase-like lactoylglutathione lyase family enzyme
MTQLDLRGVCTLLQVFDMPRSVQFYCDVLGFEIANRSPTYAVEHGVELFHWVLLGRDGVELMLNTAYDVGQRPATPAAERTAAHDDTQLYFTCADVDAAYAHVKAHGVVCAPPTTAPYGMRQLAFHDPDGFAITLQRSAE